MGKKGEKGVFFLCEKCENVKKVKNVKNVKCENAKKGEKLNEIWIQVTNQMAEQLKMMLALLKMAIILNMVQHQQQLMQK